MIPLIHIWLHTHIKLRLVEQACGCCTVHGGGGVKVRARLCLWQSGGQHLQLHHEPAYTDCGLQRNRHASSDWWSKLAAALRCEAEAESRCVLISAPGTRVESACHHDHDHTAALIVVCNGAAMQAPTGGASFRLLHGARRRRSQGACSSLPLALGWRVLTTVTTHLHFICGLHRCRHASSD